MLVIVLLLSSLICERTAQHRCRPAQMQTCVGLRDAVIRTQFPVPRAAQLDSNSLFSTHNVVHGATHRGCSPSKTMINTTAQDDSLLLNVRTTPVLPCPALRLPCSVTAALRLNVRLALNLPLHPFL
ncbi:hypothetical protein O3P69_020903 [Scylla paramamosain]|uniref:Secreted protein n=1 Tax=Scylla paramamosain TaxID=85552 RepID=A0AAW0TPL2_SCYPA